MEATIVAEYLQTRPRYHKKENEREGRRGGGRGEETGGVGTEMGCWRGNRGINNRRGNSKKKKRNMPREREKKIWT